MSKKCLCDSNRNFDTCCEVFLSAKKYPSTAVELMRSRYSAYVLKNGQYLYDTCSKSLKNIEDISIINNQDIQWLSLKIGSFSDKEVTFMAYYKEEKQIIVMKEKSSFILEENQLKYDSGIMLESSISRNEACPCGSGKKYKKCCAKG
ncbi:SEC-C domain-containing protein [Sulfurimonas sp. MAG313]|nr:YchJ family metal-binding protein [Sulfurimonas sp. MAG313]MDF1880238.1 SEC-C domain-containing protein [Sulfurimonas sp. MAG313]